MDIFHQITLLVVLLLLPRKGAAGVTGSGSLFWPRRSVLSAVPVAGLALILSYHRFMSEARALTNLIATVHSA
ncbi:hypothetical protein ACNKHK_22825 [Shigella flexneri]